MIAEMNFLPDSSLFLSKRIEKRDSLRKAKLSYERATVECGHSSIQ